MINSIFNRDRCYLCHSYLERDYSNNSLSMGDEDTYCDYIYKCFKCKNYVIEFYGPESQDIFDVICYKNNKYWIRISFETIECYSVYLHDNSVNYKYPSYNEMFDSNKVKLDFTDPVKLFNKINTLITFI